MKDNKNNSILTNEITAIKRMNYLRGLFAVLIVIGHCSMMFEKEILPLLIIHKFNMVAVGFFFIVSGWSLSYNCNNRKNYLKGFLVKKCVKLFLFALVSTTVSAILSSLVLSVPIDLKPGTLLSFNWYIYEMLIFYAIFFIAYKIKWKKQFRLIFIWAFSLIFSLVSLCLVKHNLWITAVWYFSSLCFAWGITIQECYDFFKKVLNKRVLTSIVLLIIAGISCLSLKMPRDSFIGGVIMHNTLAIGIMSVVAIWAHYIDYTKIPILDKLTDLSTEIYLYQFVALNIVFELFARKGLSVNMLYVLFVLIGTILLAIVMHFVDKFISKGLMLLTEPKKVIRS